jgi:hypothetical protein
MTKSIGEFELPVFLPGNNRNWEQVDGLCWVSEEGQLVIQVSPENAALLVDQAKRGILYQVSLDYRMPIEKLQEIENQYKEPTND